MQWPLIRQWNRRIQLFWAIGIMGLRRSLMERANGSLSRIEINWKRLKLLAGSLEITIPNGNEYLIID